MAQAIPNELFQKEHISVNILSKIVSVPEYESLKYSYLCTAAKA